MPHRLDKVDWHKEWRYLEAPHTPPSESDLVNSFMDGGIDREIATALAALFVVLFRRLVAIEDGLSSR